MELTRFTATLIVVSLLRFCRGQIFDTKGFNFVVGFPNNQKEGTQGHAPKLVMSTDSVIPFGVHMKTAVGEDIINFEEDPIILNLKQPVVYDLDKRPSGSSNFNHRVYTDGLNTGSAVVISHRIGVFEKFSVYALNPNNYTYDGYTAIPTESAGYEYMALTGYDRGSQILITALEGEDTNDKTTVYVTMPERGVNTTVYYTYLDRDYGPGDTFSIQLTVNAVWQITSDNQDLSGLVLNATKKILVTAGNHLVSWDANKMDPAHLIESMPPLDTWGKEFILTPGIRNLYKDKFRILATQADTLVEIYQEGNPTATKATMDKCEVFDSDTIGTSTYVTIKASRPVGVVQLVATEPGGSSGKYQAVMVWVPPVTQLPGSVWFSTPNVTSVNRANILVDEAYEEELLFDREVMTDKDDDNRWRTLAAPWREHRQDVTNGDHTLGHVLNVPVSVMVLGYTEDGQAAASQRGQTYAYFPGYRMTDFTLPTTTTQVTTTTTEVITTPKLDDFNYYDDAKWTWVFVGALGLVIALFTILCWFLHCDRKRALEYKEDSDSDEEIMKEANNESSSDEEEKAKF